MRLLLIGLLVCAGCRTQPETEDISGDYRIMWATRSNEHPDRLIVKCVGHGFVRFLHPPITDFPNDRWPVEGEHWRAQRQPDGTYRFTERLKAAPKDGSFTKGMSEWSK